MTSQQPFYKDMKTIILSALLAAAAMLIRHEIDIASLRTQVENQAKQEIKLDQLIEGMTCIREEIAVLKSKIN